MADQPPADEKKKKAPKPKFGQILNLGSGRMWTVESSEGGDVTIMQREGDRMVRRHLTEEEFGSAIENPLPNEYQRLKPPRGLSIGMYREAGRVIGYDAATGEVQFEGPKGISWAPGKSLSGGASNVLERDSSEGGGGGLADVGSRSAKGGETEQEGGVIHRAVGGFLARNVKDLTGGLVDLKKLKNNKSSGGAAGSDETPAASPAPAASVPDIESEASEQIPDEIFADEAEEEIKVDPAVGLVETISRTGSDDVLKYIDEQEIPEDVLKSEVVQGAVFQRLVNDFANREPKAALELAERAGVSPDQIRLAAAQAAEYFDEQKHKWLEGFPEHREKFEASMEPVRDYLLKSEAAAATKQSAPSVSISKTIVVGGTPAKTEKPTKSGKSSVSVSKTIAVGGAAAATAAVAGTVAVTASVASAAPVAASAAPAAATVSVKAKVSVPSIRDTRAQMRGDMQTVAAQVKQLYSAPAPSTARGGDQQQLYAKAANALEVMSARVASQRSSIQGMQGEAQVLRDEISGLNAQPTADSAQKIQTASKKLGNVNNRMAISRFNLQADEASVQQLKIGTNLMRKAAPEVAAGRVPASVIKMVEQSIPADIPPPSPARAAALISSMSEVSEPPPHPEEGAGGGGAPRSYSATPPTELRQEQKPSRGISLKKNLTPLPSTSDFLSAQRPPGSAGGYQPGLGAEYPNSVINTIPASYAKVKETSEEEKAQDIFTAGGGAASSEFAKKQREAQETQEQFLPETTPGIEGTTFEKDTDRAQSVRNEPQPEDMAAAQFNAARQRTRLASMQTSLVDEEEGKKSNNASALKKLKQLESVRRNFSRMWDLFNAAIAVATVETVIGALWEIFMLLANMNGRVLSAMLFRNPKSLVRKFLPTAQFPYEFAAIIAMDIFLFVFVFLSICITMLPIIIIAVLMTSGIGGLIFAVTSS